MDFMTILQLSDSSLRLATPLLLACLAGLFSERAGIFDIGLEGKMLAAAFFSAAFAFSTGNVWIGLGIGIIASVVLSLLHGLASITFRGNQLISGVAINFLAAGLTVVISQTWFSQGGRTPALTGDARFSEIVLPGAASRIRDIAQQEPVGQVYSELLSGHSILVYIALVIVPLTWWVLYRTRFGLRLRAVGENPAAVDTAGISVVGLRYAAVVICGVLCGLAGAYLATGLSAGFVKDMSAGRGFIALAALIFAKWRPWEALGACLLFGFLDAVGNRFQNIELLTFLSLTFLFVVLIGGILLVLRLVALLRGKASASDLAIPVITLIAGLVFAIGLPELDTSAGVGALLNAIVLPVQFMQALPYILTVVILAGFVGRAIPPRAGGEPYVKER
ncbi:ABC transporter permease [Hasllibacter sp. MH4015]|uniref:ABC transporter permease n=1 Tax=Hasllibacter sp. MH4015 TaxID=2854029 RepID=UPI001CD604F5|nr:ABC transporter permease [Hasllibacter sp. MH4015]